jgi:AbrB family looped-hinge helix DNA binding protein
MRATVTSKGRVTIPAEVRKNLGLRAGSRLEIIVQDDGRLDVIALTSSVRSVKGMVPKPTKPLGLADMDQAIADGARR